MKLLLSLVALAAFLALASAGYINSGWSSPAYYSRPYYSGWSGYGGGYGGGYGSGYGGGYGSGYGGSYGGWGGYGSGGWRKGLW